MNKKMKAGCSDYNCERHISMDLVLPACVEVINHMNTILWPFNESEIDEIVFDDLLEHSINFSGILDEVYRGRKKWIGLEYLIKKFIRIFERFFCWILPVREINYELEVVNE